MGQTLACDLIADGICSGSCMVAEGRPEGCDCRCGGAYHGALAHALVTPGEVTGQWWDVGDVWHGQHIVELPPPGWSVNVKRLESGWCIEMGADPVRFSKPRPWHPEFKRFIHLLLLTRRVTTIAGMFEPTNELPGFDLFAYGIRSESEALAILSVAEVYVSWCVRDGGRFHEWLDALEVVEVTEV